MQAFCSIRELPCQVWMLSEAAQPGVGMAKALNIGLWTIDFQLREPKGDSKKDRRAWLHHGAAKPSRQAFEPTQG